VSIATESLTRNQAARRERVIKAAMDLASEGGYDAVQMRDVAARAQVALGTIYRYFASKDHLLAAAQVQWSRDMQRRLAQRPARGDTAVERVVDVVRRATRAMERQELLASALITAISSSDPAVAECQREVDGIMAGMLADSMDGVDAGVQQGVVRVLGHVWFASLLGWVNGWTGVEAVGDELEHAARLLLHNQGGRA
jgi:AcrR family transcriptional regulator